jgi:glucokinase
VDAPALAVEIGGTKLQLALGRGDGRLLAVERRDVEPARGAEGVRAQIRDAFAAIREGRGPIAVAGVGFGGPVDADRGVVTTSHQVAGWDGFPLADWARATLGLDRVVVQNDADTAALGEAVAGAGRGYSPLLYVNSGSGVGGGLVVDGAIYRGSGRGAVEVGHVWIEPPDPSRGVPGATLESLASGWAIGRAGRSAARGAGAPALLDRAGGEVERITGRLVATLAAEGDPACLAVMAGATEAMARGLAYAVTLLAPRRIVLGGGVSLAAPAVWLEPIARRLGELAFPPFRGTFDVVPAALGEEVVLHGAIALAISVAGGSRPT